MKVSDIVSIVLVVILFITAAVMIDNYGDRIATLEELIEQQNEQIVYCEQRIDELQAEVDEANEFIDGLIDELQDLNDESKAIPEEEPTKELEPLGQFVCTAYCSCEKCVGPYYTEGTVYTASGEPADENITIAADWNVLPKGTKVYIEGVGERIVQDKGGAIKGNRIDIYMGSKANNGHAKACAFGKQTLKVYLVKE